MKRRVKIVFSIIFIIFLLAGAAVVMVYHSDWAGEKNDDSCATVSYAFELSASDKDMFMVLFTYEDDSVEERLFVKELEGGLLVTIYGAQGEYNPDSFDRNSVMKPEYELVREEIGGDGRYLYSLNGCSVYVVCVELTQASGYADVSETMYRWLTNWDYLLERLGLKSIRHMDIRDLEMKME